MSDRDRIRIEPMPRQVRVMLGGEFIADTVKPLLVWEIPYYPTYFFPEADVRTDLLVETGETRSSPEIGEATEYALKLNGAEGVAYSYQDSAVEQLRGYYAFVWDSMDHWFEENEEVYVHVRDPYSRVDILPSQRRVRVEVAGVTVADTTHASFLYETGLPTRYYMPKSDVRMDLLLPTDSTSQCPYKGVARYWSLNVEGNVYEDIVWGYDFPRPESQKIAGMVCFYNEKVDIFIDEEPEERPQTPFS